MPDRLIASRWRTEPDKETLDLGAIHEAGGRSVILAIQPAYGDAWTRRQFQATLDEPVSIKEQQYRQTLTQEEFSCLVELHPDGRAACWGGTRSQSTKITQLRRGDLVLLTGQRHVRGVGEVGAVVHNHSFARTLWAPRPGRCAFEIAYTLSWFRRVEVAYAVLQTALGTSDRDNFQAMRLVRDRQRVDAVHGLIERRLL
jgi:hypothetical protein